ncbi:MAG TPA: HAMP domain-containing protein [Geobacteraceae bacterium]|nr:HAMP domain-containing protein [Geobacteraceae bacterium]
MMKTLAGKAIIPVTLAVTGFVIVCCLLLYSIIKSDMTGMATLHATSLANVVVKATRYSMLTTDRETLRNIIKDIGEQQDVEHVRIFNKQGVIEFSSDAGEVNRLVDKKTAGCIGCHAGPVPVAKLGAMRQARQFVNGKGREVLAITAPIYNEPECFGASCHFHAPGNKVLGTLDIGLSRKPLRDALATMRGRMVVFTFLILVLTVGGTAALLRRSILTPVRIMTDYCKEMAGGAPDRELPGFEGELEELALSLKTIAGVMKKERKSAPGCADKNGR